MQRIEYELSNDDYVEYNLHLARTSEVLTKQSSRLRLFGSLTLVVVAFLVIGSAEGSAVIGTLVGVAFGALVWFTWPKTYWWIARQTVRRIARKQGLGRTGRTQLWTDDTGLHERTAVGEATVAWSGVHRVEETPTHAFIFLGPVEALIVPLSVTGAENLISEVRRHTSS